jgi:hypothetical protein
VTVGSGVYDALPDAPFAVAAKKLLPDLNDVTPNTSCTNRNPVSTPDAMGIITGSPSSDILLKRHFTELNKKSCIRLDKVFDGSISVGGETYIFDIPTSIIKDIRIFVDKECLGQARKLKKKLVKKITKHHGVCSLRQIRSKFHKLDTYMLTRYSGPFTASPAIHNFYDRDRPHVISWDSVLSCP